MFVITKIFFSSIIFRALLIDAKPSTTTRVFSKPSINFEKFFLNGFKPVNFLRVFSEQYEPFMNRNENGKFNNGIEFKLFEIIAKKERLDLIFLKPPDYKHQTFE